ncbi:hypothetical protein VIGAN_05126000 [Vigna angularis var. angularis]|uniref:Uncharacterized protein n=1 Tax=Vigna angularis var. angularis TaxID=157739 RepID=A0A0S3S4R6_PHAAN|nr:hypothetical protein VIGAN_05126000 [Vigna angularis var. angularis]
MDHWFLLRYEGCKDIFTFGHGLSSLFAMLIPQHVNLGNPENMLLTTFLVKLGNPLTLTHFSATTVSDPSSLISFIILGNIVTSIHTFTYTMML